MPTRHTHTTSLLIALTVLAASALPVEAQGKTSEARLMAVAHVGEHTIIRRATYPAFTQSAVRASTTVSARGNVPLDLFVRLDAPGRGIIEVMDARGSFRPLRLNELVRVSTKNAGAHEVTVTWRVEGNITADAPSVSYVIAPARDVAVSIASR